MEAQIKKVKADFSQVNGNAVALMIAFSRAAASQGWSKEEVDVVLNDCMSKDYVHLCNVLAKHTTT